ncbi:MAG: ArsR family transcriptional regulator [Thaumarchaeota archaeon]|nr:ArsR family transcriptional regulator [Nitrososphaerota archaeon]
MLEKYEDLLSKARKAELGALSTWYKLFGLREDPFLAQIEPEETDYFVDRERLVESIVFDVGIAARGIPVTILLVGPTLSGKTAILQYIGAILERLAKKGPDRYAFSGELLDAGMLFEVDEEEAEHKSVQPWLRLAKKQSDYLFLDSAAPEQVKLVIREFTKVKLKLFSVLPHDLEVVYSELKVEPKLLFISRMAQKGITSVLTGRLARVSDGQASLQNLFGDESLKIIDEYCMGVPGLALVCASRCLRLLRNLYAHGSPEKLVERTKVTADIALQACKIEKCYQAVEEYPNLSQFKREVLEQVIFSGKSPTEISSTIRKDRTTVSRHLMDLKEAGLVDFTPRGRESVYQAVLPTRILYEISRMPKEVWEGAPA